MRMRVHVYLNLLVRVYSLLLTLCGLRDQTQVVSLAGVCLSSPAELSHLPKARTF